MVFQELFVGRRDIYAQQYLYRGKWIFKPVKSLFTHTILRQHFRGYCTLGSYDVVGEFTKRLVIDIDTCDRRVLQEVLQRCYRLGIPVAIEFSGRKGYHIWLFFEQPIPKIDVQHIGKHLAPGHEVFPKQSTTNYKNPGNLIKLPLGIHQATGRRCVFVDNSLMPLLDQWAYLNELVEQKISSATIKRMLMGIPQKKIFSPGKNVVGNDLPRSGCLVVRSGDFSFPLRSCIVRMIKRGMHKGFRNSVAHAIATELFCRGFSYEDALSVIQAFNVRCRPPLEDYELQGIIYRCYTYSQKYYYGCKHPVVRPFCNVAGDFPYKQGS